MIYDYAIIGAGLFGSSAAKYLSQQGKTLVFAPAEPADYSQHQGVFASHYDSGRSIKVVSSNFIEGQLAQRGMQRYRAIEKASRCRFYEPVGSVMWQDAATLEQAQHTSHKLKAQHQRLAAADVQQHFPYIGLLDDYEALYEPAPAGYLNPRIFKQAQLRIAQQQGAAILETEVLELSPETDSVRIGSQRGDYRAKKVLIATGPYVQASDWLELAQLDFRVKTESIMLAHIDERQAEKIKDMPVLLYAGAVGSLNNFYLLPPIRYPDGSIYLKIGADTTTDAWLQDKDAMQAWMQQGDNSHQLEDFTQALYKHLPELRIENTEIKRCIVSYSQHGNPYIDIVRDGQVYLVTGGNGHGANMAEGVGALAASLVQHNAWCDDVLEAADFRALPEAPRH